MGSSGHASRLERTFAYHLARNTWPLSTVAKARVELPAAAQAAAAARRRARAELGALLEEGELELVEILVTELVTNAVAHAGLDRSDNLVLHLAAAWECVRVEVCDGGVGFTPDALGRPRREPGGYGLMMVDRAASRWGIATDEGNCVWFELDRPGR